MNNRGFAASARTITKRRMLFCGLFSRLPKSRVVLLSILGLCVWQPVVSLAQEAGNQKPPTSLYERLGDISEDRLGGQKLGGAYKIAAIVSDLIDRLQTNKVINANPSIKKISGPAMPGHKFEFTLMICSLAGGPQKYAGRSLTEAHSSLGITEKEWNAMKSELKIVLDKHKVPPAEQREFISLIEGTRTDIAKP